MNYTITPIDMVNLKRGTRNGALVYDHGMTHYIRFDDWIHYGDMSTWDVMCGLFGCELSYSLNGTWARPAMLGTTLFYISNPEYVDSILIEHKLTTGTLK